jgi:2-keto-4-pentenoate hydratase/2-oxohepta-3-ene-1,7-dioic acid hydratase in catechol pathway
MKLVTYRADGTVRAGVQVDGGVLDAAELLGTDAISVRELIADARLSELGERLAGAEVEPVADPALLPPLPDPDKIVCIGLNYRSHAAEAGIDPPEYPTFFAKFRNALAPPARA